MKYAAHALVFTIAMLSALGADRPSQKPAPPTHNRFIRIKPPVFLSTAKLPHDVKSEFRVAGHAGQFLRVVVDENAEYDAPFSVSALAPDGSELKPDDCVNDLAYPLPQTGEYRISFDPSGVEHTLRLTLLAHNDPLMDVGIKLPSLGQLDQVVRSLKLSY